MTAPRGLPIGPPLEPMLAKHEPEIPRGDGWRYEPKWDGFRAIVFRDGDDIHIGSRGRRPLHRYFPELLPVLRDRLPARCVVDGEIVLAGPDGALDFELLQLRLHPAESRVNKLAAETPSAFVAFDLLAEGSKDLRKEPLGKRWARLEKALGVMPTGRAMKAILSRKPRVVLSPQTEKPEVAVRWFDELEPAGLDGVIAKKSDLRYQPGKRVMVKVKHQRTIDCVVGGYRVHKSGQGVGSLMLGLYDDGRLRHVGACGAFSTADRLAIRRKLQPLEGGEGFPGREILGGPSRWNPEEKDWIPVRPVLVCEVAYDHFQGGHRFRHLAQFLRWRNDVDPRDCTFDQARPGRG